MILTGLSKVVDVSVSTMIYLNFAPSVAIERILSRGYRAVELSYDNLLYGKYDEPAELLEVAEAVSKYSVRYFSVHLPYDNIGGTESSLATTLGRISRWVKALDRVSVGHYVAHLPRLPHTKESLALATKFLSGLLGIIGDSYVAIENNPTTSLLGAYPEDIFKIIEEVASENVVACVDVGHANISRVALRRFHEILGSRVVSVHIHDNDGLEDKHMMPGSGSLNLDELSEFIAFSRPRVAVFEVACKEHQRCDQALTYIRRIAPRILP